MSEDALLGIFGNAVDKTPVSPGEFPDDLQGVNDAAIDLACGEIDEIGGNGRDALLESGIKLQRPFRSLPLHDFPLQIEIGPGQNFGAFPDPHLQSIPGGAQRILELLAFGEIGNADQYAIKTFRMKRQGNVHLDKPFPVRQGHTLEFHRHARPAPGDALGEFHHTGEPVIGQTFGK